VHPGSRLGFLPRRGSCHEALEGALRLTTLGLTPPHSHQSWGQPVPGGGCSVCALHLGKGLLDGLVGVFPGLLVLLDGMVVVTFGELI